MNLGETKKHYCEVIDKSRSLLYDWLGRDGNLQNKKPAAKTYPTKISEVKETEVLVEYGNHHGLVGGGTIAGLVGGISPSKASAIIRERGSYIRELAKELCEKIKNNHYNFLRAHVCWSWDYMHVRVSQEWLYLQVLRDEYSRYVLGWILTGGVTGEQVVRFIGDTINKYRIKPLVIKRDNDIALRANLFGEFLRETSIIDLPSPGYYPKYQGHHERGNADFRKHLNYYELNPCTTYGEMEAEVERVADFINNKMPRTIFDGKTSAEIFNSSRSIEDIYSVELIQEISNLERIRTWAFPGKNGMRKLHRYSVIEVLKNHNLLDVEMSPWQEFGKKKMYN